MNRIKTDNPLSSIASQLSNIDDLFQSVEAEIEREIPDAYRSEKAIAGGEGLESAAPYVRAAAVLCAFEPELIHPLGEYRGLPPTEQPFQLDHPLYTLVGHSAVVIDVKGQIKRSLRDDVRREALTELIETDQVRQALNANEAAAFDQTDTAQTVFRDVLTGSLPPLNELRLDQLTALQRIAPWVAGLDLPVPFPAKKVLRFHLERERLLDPFRQLIGRFVDGKFVEHFRGRKKELRRLREYVDVAQAETFYEATMRAASGAVAQLFNLQASPPLVIHGTGGVGKSTLMAKFLLQHAEAQQLDQFPFVYIDFDGPDVRPINAHTLLAEMARQLTMQYAEAEPELTEFRKQMLDKQTQSESLDPVVPVTSFCNIFLKLLPEGRPLLLVLDTLEEVQQSSRDEVHDLFEFLDRLQGAFRMLRTVIAGRAPVTEDQVGFNATNYPLLDLDQEAATGFLLSRGISDEAVASEIISLAGRQPLALKLAADLVAEQGVEGIRDVAGGSGVLARFRRVWSQTDITGRLYQRLLKHITDPDARKLAHPGLVLRRITSEIIRKVLAEPCGLGVIDEAEADDYFEKLRRQVSLVSPAEPGVLRHRADVRQMMLPLILKAEKDIAQQIQERAVRYYGGHKETGARAEEIYHRLMLGESPRSVEPRWVDGLKPHLSNALEELPPAAQAFVAARIDEERPNEVWLAADLEDWEIYAERRIRKLLKNDEPERAFEVAHQRTDRSSTSRMAGVDALVLHALGRDVDARTAADKAVDRFSKAGIHQDLVQELEKLTTPLEDKAGRQLLEQSELKQIVAVLGSMDFVYSSDVRFKLFSNIQRDLVNRIPLLGHPQQQLHLDLNLLNAAGKLSDGSHPLVIWLEQAVSLVGKRPQTKVLQAALIKAGRRAGGKDPNLAKSSQKRMK